MAARSRHELDGGLRRAAGRNQVVDQQHARAFVNGVGMNFDRIGSIFKIVFLADGLPRQLALLAHRHETKSELMGNRTTENEATRFDRSEEHTSELQSLMRISYAVFCLKKQT